MPMKSEYAIETPDECRGSDNRQFTTLTLTHTPLPHLLTTLSPPLIAMKNRIERIDIYAKMGKCDAACQMR